MANLSKGMQGTRVGFGTGPTGPMVTNVRELQKGGKGKPGVRIAEIDGQNMLLISVGSISLVPYADTDPVLRLKKPTFNDL